jgi:hypothetical protein
MLALKYLLMFLGAALFGSSGALVAYDIFLSEQLPAFALARQARRTQGSCKGSRPAESRAKIFNFEN